MSRIDDGQPGLSRTDCCSSGISCQPPLARGLEKHRPVQEAKGKRRWGSGAEGPAHRHPCRVGEVGEAWGVGGVARGEAVEQRAALMLRPPRQGSMRAGLPATSPL